ncbi:MAG: response regulator [Emcibacter sp.]|nr:response regulator [Emcibacter sp.]
MYKNPFGILRILIIDDQGSMRSIIRALLNSNGMHLVTEASEGGEALKIMAREKKSLDVVICDLHMKGMDGLAFCQKVRLSKDPRIKDVKIIVLTGDKDTFIHGVSTQVGAVSVLSKPVTADELKIEIAKAVDIEL